MIQKLASCRYCWATSCIFEHPSLVYLCCILLNKSFNLRWAPHPRRRASSAWRYTVTRQLTHNALPTHPTHCNCNTFVGGSVVREFWKHGGCRCHALPETATEYLGLYRSAQILPVLLQPCYHVSRRCALLSSCVSLIGCYTVQSVSRVHCICFEAIASLLIRLRKIPT